MRYFNTTFAMSIFFLMLSFVSCKKNETDDTYNSGTENRTTEPAAPANVDMAICGSVVLMDLVKNQGRSEIDMGDVAIYNDGANLYIDVNPIAPCFINSISLYIGDCSKAPSSGNSGNAAPQSFPIQIGPSLGALTYIVTIPLSDLPPCYCIAMQVQGGGGLGTAWLKGTNAVPYVINNNSGGYVNEYCTQECEIVDECEWQEETAFGGATAGAGNAWWYAMDASASGSYPIYAGQIQVSGASVDYNAATDVITINLGPNMQLRNVNEAVKVQGYNTLPNSRPAAGQFTLYKGNSLTVQGNNSNHYVIHLDVEVCNR